MSKAQGSWKGKIFAALILGITCSLAILAYPNRSLADDFVVYGVYRPLDLGNPGETPLRDYYVNIGSAQGIRSGSSLEVMRRSATYDVTTQKLYKDMVFPIARLKVIHAESNAAIARLEQMIPSDKAPAILPRAVMVGDLVRPAGN